VNLRARGILLSILPVALILLLAVPEIIVQLDADRAVTRATASDFLSAVARSVEEAALDVGGATRDLGRRTPDAQAALSAKRDQLDRSLERLHALALDNAAGRESIRRVTESVNAYLQIMDGAANDLRAGQSARALLTINSREFSLAARRVRQDVLAFDGLAHSNELAALAAVERLRRLSLLLLGSAAAAAVLISILQLVYSRRDVNAILTLADKAQRYRRGEPLGTPSLTADEFGILDAALHDFVAAHHTRERQLQRYRLLADVTQDIILFIDRLDLTVVDANAAALAAYGYERSELIGKPTAMLHAVEDPIDSESIALSDTVAGLSYEGVHLRSDGTVFPVEVHAGTAEVDGRLTIIKTIRNISERRRAAEQVASALEEAVAAAQLKGEFVATMSHEIRTPMHGVIAMTELLLETPLDAVQHDYAITLKESAQALLAIIDDILDFSKLEANRIELEAVAFELAPLVAGVVNMVRITARDKGLALRTYVSPHVPRALRGDPTRLRQVLINLIGNAVKFTESGSVTVSISVQQAGKTSVDLLFTVSDTGIGVVAETRERLFEPFVQGDGSTTRQFGGTGLGLSISRRLVELMDGRLWLGEHEGPGATFCFTGRFERTEEPVAAPELPAGALRVLVLDNDATARLGLEALLGSWGMRAAAAVDAEAARAALRSAARSSTPFDAVLIDFVLPQSDGLAFATEVGAPEYGSPARILLTPVLAAGRTEAALAAGCAACLPKPINPSDLYDVLVTVDRSRKARAGGTARAAQPARILLAEDSALIRRVARFQLDELAYGVDIVENGAQAVAAVANGNYELVLMDMRMPEMDGLHATRAIRAAERETGRHVVVVALTANVLDGDREACIAAGMDDFLAKPLQLDALRAVLQRWLPGRV
jgi:two-component system sensor histidine kinase/response regulator